MEGQTYTEAALSLGRWLSSEWRWDAFATLTFAPVKGQGSARGKGRRSVERAMRTRLGGSDWTAVGVAAAEKQLGYWLDNAVVSRAPHAYWWFAVEAHKFRTTPHFHGLVGGIRGAEWRDMWEDWYYGMGMGRLEPIRDSDAVGVYVAKYVNKGLGKVYTSPGLENASISAIELRSREREAERIKLVAGRIEQTRWRL